MSIGTVEARRPPSPGTGRCGPAIGRPVSWASHRSPAPVRVLPQPAARARLPRQRPLPGGRRGKLARSSLAPRGLDELIEDDWPTLGGSLASLGIVVAVEDALHHLRVELIEERSQHTIRQFEFLP